MTQKERSVLDMMYDNFKSYQEDWKEFRKDQKEINQKVIEHEVKIQSIWKIPVISGGVVTLLLGIAGLLQFLL